MNTGVKHLYKIPTQNLCPASFFRNLVAVKGQDKELCSLLVYSAILMFCCVDANCDSWYS